MQLPDYQLAVSRLQSELEKLKIESIRDFVIPGSIVDIDLYLPELPRAAVEIKVASTRMQLERGIETASRLQEVGHREFGPTFVAILLVFRRPNKEPASDPKIPAGVESIILDLDPCDATAMAIAAGRIADIMTARRNRLLARPAARATSQRGAIGAAIGGILFADIAANLFSDIDKLGSVASGSGLDADHGARPKPDDRAVHEPRSTAEDLQRIEKQVNGILDTLRTLAPDAHFVVRHEMDCLVDEFRSEHFTACALRAGRCVESVVYELSRRWDIELGDATFGRLNEVRKALDHLGDLLGDFEGGSQPQRKALHAKLDNALLQFSNQATAVMLAVKNRQMNVAEPAKSESTPRPIVALLKRIRSRYGSTEGVVEAIRSLLETPRDSGERSPIERILETRNRAAHAHMDGRLQEIDRKTVTQLVDDINLVILRLSTVAIAIQHAGSLRN